MDFLTELLQPFQWGFMRNALLAVLVISPLFGLLSTMVVTSRMSFFSDALGHSAFTGIAIGTLCGLADPLWMAVLLAAAFALLFTYVRRKSNMASDTVIGVFSSTAVALGIFIATFGGGSFTQYNSLLIGDILSVEPSKIALLAVILLVVAVLWLVSFNRLMLSAIHPALADSRGVRVFWQEAVFSIAIAVVVTVSMTWVGLLVINSLLVLPAAAGRNVAKNMRQYHLSSVLAALIAGLAGLMTSYYLGSSAGASCGADSSAGASASSAGASSTGAAGSSAASATGTRSSSGAGRVTGWPSSTSASGRERRKLTCWAQRSALRRRKSDRLFWAMVSLCWACATCCSSWTTCRLASSWASESILSRWACASETIWAAIRWADSRVERMASSVARYSSTFSASTFSLAFRAALSLYRAV
mgnify:CR=1 FL=1